MKIVITITDDEQSAEFVSGTAGIWGVYRGPRVIANQWLTKGRSAMEERWCDVALGGTPAHFDRVGWDGVDQRDQDTFRWVQTECPLIALATMCAEWGAPS